MKLLDQVRHVARLRRLALQTERCYVRWVEQYVRFHKTADGFRHPSTLGAEDVERFLTFRAVQRRVSASTQNQAFAALLFLYRDVLHLDLGAIDALRARRTRRLPVVLTREEAALLLAGLDALPTREPYGLMARLMYGAGLRLLECCRLRVKDVDLTRDQIVVRQGKGDKDRVVMLPTAADKAVADQVRWRLALHKRDREQGARAGPACPTPSTANTRRRRFPPAGSSSSRRASCRMTRAAVTGGAGTFILAPPSGPSPGPWPSWAGPSASAATPSATVSPPTCWRWATTSAPSRNCSATRTSARR